MIKTLSLILVLLSAQALAQTTDKFAVFDGKGNPSSVADIVKSLETADVVFLGEMHDDTVGHAVQLEIFRRAIESYSATRRLTLSIEMFESDVQIVLNEYLAGLISENHFLLSSRPWGNYKADYRPLVELAKEKKLDVVAANAPRRYVNMVSRNGRDALNALSPEAKRWLAPLPYAEASEAYSKKFKALMGSSPEARSGIDNILASQSLWDATMAHSVAQSLKKNKGSLVVHLNGGFHTEGRLGTVEHLLKYRPKTRVVVVTIRYEEDFKKFDPAKHTGLGDFVVLTAPKPKTQSVLSDILRRMDNYYQSLTSLKSDLTMVRYNSQLNESDIYKGTLSYLPKAEDRDLKIRVNWTSPVKEQLSLNRDRFELYMPRLGQVFAGDLKDDKKNSAEASIYGLLHMSREQLRANFAIAFMGEETISQNVKTWHLQLNPKKPTFFKYVDVWIDVDGMTRQVKVMEENGDTTAIQLSNFKTNLEIEDKVFKIVYPSSVKNIPLH